MELEQLEALALGEDRSPALQQLIPGSEEYYFYHCLDHEHGGRLREAQALLKPWIERHGRTTRVQQIERRLALLSTDFAYLEHSLGLHFGHAREVEGQVSHHPERVEPSAISWEKLSAQALARYSNLDGFTDRGLLSLSKVDDDRRAHLLGRQAIPDHPQLMSLIIADLKEPRRAFGSPIHLLLTAQQLEELARALPALRNDRSFVSARLRQLQPSPDSDWQRNSAEQEAHFGRLWALVEPLPPAFNELKAHVLYHRLSFDQQWGVYDRKRFTQYLGLPRRTSYIKQELLDRNHLNVAGLNQDFSSETLLPPVQNDLALVTDYLSHFLRDARTFDEFLPWVRDDFLKELFATTKILAGLGDQEQWYSLLGDPTGYQALKERVDIDLAPSNRRYFGAHDKVTLEVDVKNVPSLVVKVFEINTLNYLLTHGREVDTSVDLDGLVAKLEQSYEYSEPALRRVRRTFTFEALSQPGVYVVELIGNGRSSRALIQKGALSYLERLGAAGHVFTILDQDLAPLPEASLWFGGREYLPKDGEIVVPFGTHPRRQQILLRHGELTTAETFDHRDERYRLLAGLYVDRESLLLRQKAQLVVRPTLDLHGVPISLSVLEDVKLVIQSVDRHGISATLEVPNFELHADRESVHTISVPEDLARLEITLQAKVRSLSEQREVELADSASFELNGLDQVARVDALHLSRTAAGWMLYQYGKSGEPRAHRPIQLSLVHRDFKDPVTLQVQTDAAGRVELGPLAEITRLTATSADGSSEDWALNPPLTHRPSTLQARSGQPIELPWPGGPAEPRRVALLERRGGVYLRDCFELLQVEGGRLQIGPLSAGDYALFLKDEAQTIELRVTDGAPRGRWWVSRRRFLAQGDPPPVYVQAVALEGGDVVVRLGNTGPQTRVHAFGTRFFPAYSALDALGKIRPVEPAEVERSAPRSHYVSGRDIGDEYRYILERRSAPKFAGNLLGRPGLLLNPWAIRKTAMGHAVVGGGGAYAPSPAEASLAARGGPAARRSLVEARSSESLNLDFLPGPAAVWLNQRPDAQGVLRLPRAVLEQHSQLRLVVVDGTSTLAMDVPLPEPPHQPQDQRLLLALDAQGHYAEKKQVSLLSAAEPLVLEDVTTSSIESFDSLARVFRLYQTLTGNSHLKEMAFVVEWPRLSEAEKRAKYSQYACHELSFFLSRKDPEFFRTVIKPYLVHKKDPTFMDHFLLEVELSGYLEPWAYGRLNVLERILLAQRMPNEAGPTARHLRERFELLPADPEEANRLFDTGIKGSALESSDSFGLVEAQDKAAASGFGAMQAIEQPKQKKSRSSGRRAKEEAFSEFDDESVAYAADEGGPGGPMDRDLAAREESRALFRKIDKTEELAENNYYKVRIQAQDASLIEVNAFWRDYAAHDCARPFLSAHFARATRNFSEMMAALSVLDLPFEAEEHQVRYAGARMELTAGSRAIVLHREIRPVVPSERPVSVLVSQNYLRLGDEYEEEGGESVEKHLRGELLTHVVYLSRVVLTNPSSKALKLDLLLQIPAGAIPVHNGFRTKGLHVELGPRGTKTINYCFYFPVAGRFPHFPVHVAQNEALVAAASPVTLEVVDTLSTADRGSWVWVSQHGTSAEVLAYLEQHNVERLELEKLAWRMGERDFYQQLLQVLVDRHVYHDVLWSYAVKHRDLARTQEYLRHQEHFLREAGPALVSPLVRFDPIERRWYEHLEYAPLVNARAHRLGSKTKILNDGLAQQYRAFLEQASYQQKPDLLAAAYYLLLQDRVTEAIAMVERIGPTDKTQLQYDYLRAYLAFHTGALERARALAEAHREHPVDRWRKLFQNVLAQLDELREGPTVVDPLDHRQRQGKLAATQAGLELAVEERRVSIQYQNLGSCQLRYYLMDIELLFSRQPFVQQQSDRFSIVTPNVVQEVVLPPGQRELRLDLPASLQNANVVVEVVGGGIRKAQAYYAHRLGVQLVEPYGQVRLSARDSQAPVPRSYVKVYARMAGGQVRFYKDGYTDLRGCFDYATLSTDELDQVERFAILIMSEALGAVIREASPPQR